MNLWRFHTVLFALAAILLCSSARADKLRELADVEGARENQLIGYGVVTGLGGTGDDVSAPLAAQSLLSMLRRLGVQADSKQVRLRNVAAVIVTATIPPFAKPGTKIDITVSSIGNARSIEGGVLVQTLLKGADRKTYAVAQGSLILGGFSAKGKSGSSARSGSVSTGRVPEGALVERAIPTRFLSKGKLNLSLRSPSFTVAARIASAVNAKLGKGAARAVDGGTVTVKLPKRFRGQAVALIAELEQLEVVPERRARVVVSERTQTIVAGGDVRIAPVAIVHGGMTIVVKEKPLVSQPEAPLTGGETKVVPQSEIKVEERESTMHFMPGAATLSDLAGALGALGLNARELASVLQALKSAGALEAELVVQ
jgi:flagellar P-ring protein precursor FlgI